MELTGGGHSSRHNLRSVSVNGIVADGHRSDGKRFVVRADEKLTAFVELELADRKLIQGDEVFIKPKIKRSTPHPIARTTAPVRCADKTSHWMPPPVTRTRL